MQAGRDLGGGRHGGVPPIVVGHAVGAIQQDHDFSRPENRARCQIHLGEQGTGERRHQKDQGAGADQQEKPVPDLPPPHGPVGNPLEEHERRELHDPAALPPGEVHDDRHGQDRQPGEESGNEELQTHQRVLLSRCRVDR